MGKYSENPLDDILGYLVSIERNLEKQGTQRDNTELDSLRGKLSSISAAIEEIRKDNGLVSESMNTIAEAIGTVPTAEEREKQHQSDIEYIIENTKQRVVFDFSPKTKEQLDNISVGIAEFINTVKTAGESVAEQINKNAGRLSEPLNRVASNFESKINRVIEKKAEKATESITMSMVENWVWRTLALISLIVWCLVWLYPKIREIDFPNGAEGFFYAVVGIICGVFLLCAIYQWGKMNGNSYY